MITLSYYKALSQEAEQLRGIVSRLLADAASIRSPNLDGMPHTGTAGDGMELIAAAIDRAEQYKKILRQILDEQQELEAAIEHIPPLERIVIRSRFIDGNSAERTAEIIGTDVRTVFNVTNRAVNRMRKQGIEIQINGGN